MNILYLHGLDGSLSNEKREILETYGTVFSPSLDYRNDSDIITTVVQEYSKKKINVVIGSSLGGFTGFYTSDAFRRPALLFNPALAMRSVMQKITTNDNPHYNLKHIILGKEDTVIDPKQTMQFITNDFASTTDYTIKVRGELAHRIPLNVFEEEVELFFGRLCN